MTTRGRSNNFDVLRLAAAVAVIFSHSYAVLGQREPAPIVNPLGLSWGNLGVLVFFAISGYLVTQSWDRDPSARRYAAKRGLRLLPALAMVAAASAWLLGPFVTDASPREFFTSVGTWLYPPTTALVFLPSPDPPGMFSGNPRHDINASLWTIPVEVTCYVLLVALAKARIRRGVALVPFIVGAAAVGNPHLGLPLPAFAQQAALLAAAFLTGSLIHRARERIRLDPWLALAAMCVALALRPTPLGPTVGAILVPYVVLTLALATRPLRLTFLRGYDLSYGLYLFGFPIQQTWVYFTDTDNPWIITGLTLAAAVPLAALSWRWIERPALSHKPRPSLAPTPAHSP